MVKNKKEKYNTPQRECVWTEVICNTPNALWILFYGNIPPKKNSRMRARGISLPSANYMEWHKRCKKWVEGIEFKYSNFPCTLSIYSIIHNNVRKDLDNYTQSIQDFLTDVGAIPDDNNSVIPEIHTKVVAKIKNCPLTYITLTPLRYNIKEYKEDIKYDIDKMKEKSDILSNNKNKND